MAAQITKGGIRECDIVEVFIRAAGPGGQKVNKTSSCVSLKHIPSGITVKCQEHRSQRANRIRARDLAEKVALRLRQKELLKKKRQQKLRQQRGKRPRYVKERILQAKKMQAQKKKSRVKVSFGDFD